MGSNIFFYDKKDKKFNAEVGKILKLVINSIYTNKDIFVRELISNASDACDKLRYLSITNKELTSGNQKYHIEVKLNNNQNTITFEDSGIGMDAKDLEDNIGTIAKSGTESFLRSLTDQNRKNHNLIGNFGVGFY